MGSIIRDLRGAWRRLRADWRYSALAVLTLGLGIGASTAIVSVVRSVLIEPLPYDDPARIGVIWNTRHPGETTWLSAREIHGYRQDTASFERVSAIADTEANLTGGGEPERLAAAALTTDIFETLGTGASLGRTFAAGDEAQARSIVILSHGLWMRRFGGAGDIVGQSIELNGVQRTVIGVMPPEFRLPTDYWREKPSEAWTPYVIDSANPGAWGDRGLIGVVRLRRSAQPATATSELAVVWDRWVRAGYLTDQGDGRGLRSVVPAQDFVTGSIRRPLLILLATVCAVLLIAVANVANLLLARADVCGRDLAIRAALGADRRQLTRHVLAESVLLGTLGAALGLLLTTPAIRMLRALQPDSVPRLGDVRVDATILLFSIALGIVTGVLFGLLPALHFSRPQITAVLHDGGRGGTSGRARRVARHALAAAQLALSVVLATAALLLGRTIVELGRVGLGFDASGVLTAQLQLPVRDYPDPPSVVRFYDELTTRLRRLPGVRGAGAVRILPLSRTIGDWSITLEGRPFDPVENPNGDYQAVTPGYFEAMQLRLVHGRFIDEGDRTDGALVAVINETMASRYWPGTDAIGKRFHMGTANQPWVTIVGIVARVRHNAIVEDERAEMYLPHAQLPREIGGTPRGMAVVLKVEGDALVAVPALRQVVRDMDPRLPLSDIRAMEAVVGKAMGAQRFTAMLIGTLSMLALALAAVGVYGTISALVSERSREIGIRMALGAERRTIVRMVLVQAAHLAGAGVAIGLPASLLLTQFLRGLLYGVGPLDPSTFVSVPLLLATVAVLAAMFPALRAARIDPARVMGS